VHKQPHKKETQRFYDVSPSKELSSVSNSYVKDPKHQMYTTERKTKKKTQTNLLTQRTATYIIWQGPKIPV